ncbi:hypothetical protein EDB81DRAFT_803860 [Dactylonectria macrodidyma]|uniref:Zn(2)-C6 fungal-type domain-containing protein n=1 Tax=Dactylonectria macrodidyma TaxID=307937 RepID=A0A9P9IXC3_9HYPO|nr:hypothetical protein EDB81DRAFT_803860 [Dactylonectria macrodidyma]
MEPKHQAANMQDSEMSEINNAAKRTRASKACLTCRRRKVRCTLSRTGWPCVNCSVDGHDCVVVDRANRRVSRRKSGLIDKADEGRSTAEEEKAPTPKSTTASQSSLNERDGLEIPLAEDTAMNRRPSYCKPTKAHSQSGEDTITSTKNASGNAEAETAGFGHVEDQISSRPLPNEVLDGYVAPTMPSDHPHLYYQQIPFKSEVSYQTYSFIAISNLSYLPAEDIDYLDFKRCFTVPARPLLDEFVQQYFRYVHPLLPVLNEAVFWDMYQCESESASLWGVRIPLIVLQAMLFSASAFVSPKTLELLGYPNIRAARKSLYNRAKSLYDLETESSRLHVAQAALLLSYWSPSIAKAASRPNTVWLAIAIENARSVKSHQSQRVLVTTEEPDDEQIQTSLKRLWGCCIIRDSLLALSSRRNCRISQDNIDPDSGFILTFVDLAPEIHRSKVYDPATKVHLLTSFLRLGLVCVQLNRVSSILFPYELGSERRFALPPEARVKMESFYVAISEWHKESTAKLSGNGGMGVNVSKTKEALHPSIALFDGLTEVYYSCLKIALANRRMLVLAETPNSAVWDEAACHSDIQKSTRRINECMQKLSDLQLVRFLPVSIVPCTALPLALHLIDCRISTTLPSNSPSPLIKAIKLHESLYEGVDWIAKTIQVMLEQKQIAGLIEAITGTTSDRTDYWEEIVVSYPTYYLRLAMTMDLCLSQGRLPKEGDFPPSLRDSVVNEGIDNPAVLAPSDSGMVGPSLSTVAEAAHSLDHALSQFVLDTGSTRLSTNSTSLSPTGSGATMQTATGMPLEVPMSDDLAREDFVPLSNENAETDLYIPTLSPSIFFED